jgi:hypothetical protein
MKQFYFTSCIAGRGFGIDGGFQVRAVGTGVSQQRAQMNEGYVKYEKSYLVPFVGDTTDMPCRLAMLMTSDGKPIVSHAVWIGDDPTTGREGNFFSHALLDPSDTFDAFDAVILWKSPDWTCRDGEFPKELPPPCVRPGPDAPTFAAVRALAQEATGAAMLRFALDAYLTRPPAGQVFLVAPPGEVAVCVYALAIALPQAMRRALTFSTYEGNPLSCTARIVGTSWPDPRVSHDVPDPGYSNANAAFNRFTGRATALGLTSQYAARVFDLVVNGQEQALRETVAELEKLPAADAAALDLWARLDGADDADINFVNSDLSILAYNPPLLVRAVQQPTWARQLIVLLAKDAKAALSVLPALISNLRQNAQLLKVLFEAARTVGLESLCTGDITKARGALDDLLPLLAQAIRSSLPWHLLAAEIDEATRLPAASRAYLVNNLARQAVGDDRAEVVTQIRRLIVDANGDLLRFLESDVPDSAKRAVVEQWLLDSPADFPAAATQYLSAQPTHLAETLRELIAAGKTSSADVLLQRTLCGHRADQLSLHLLADPRGLPHAAIDRCVATLLGKPGTPARTLVEMLEPHRRSGAVAPGTLRQLACRLVKEMRYGLLQEPALLAFVHSDVTCAAAEPALGALLTVARFVREPRLSQERLRGLAAAGAAMPFDSGLQQFLIDQILNVLEGTRDAQVCQQSLRAALVHLGHVLARDPAELFDHLAECATVRPDAWKRLHLVSALFCVAFDTADGDSLSTFAQQRLSVGLRLVDRASRRHPRALREVDHDAASWSISARSAWRIVRHYANPGRLQTLFAGIRRLLTGA